jgi:sialate O-acetylesterase
MRPLHRLGLLTLVFASALRAEVALPKIFGDRMVLQRDLPVPVWGHAEPNEAVVIRFGSQEKRTVADAAGTWRVRLDPLAASAAPRDFVVSGTNTLTLHDVLVGEVWLCSGQSNMEMAVGTATAGAQPESAHDPAVAAEIETASFPALRLFRVEKRLQPPDVISAGWTACSGDALARFSAAGFFFGRELQHELGVPVGLIESAWGGSRIEEWTPDDAYAKLEKILGADAERTFERNAGFVSRNFDAMIRPLAPFALRGVLWYQGESQIIAYNDGLRYADKFQVFVESWRALWLRPDLPFYSVQIAPYLYTARKDKLPHADDELPKLWEAQWLSTAIPHTGVVPITDTVTDLKNIHPGKKTVVGHRLAAIALARTYDRNDAVASGPVFAGVRFSGGRAVVRFDHAEGGLVASDGKPLADFEIAGVDGNYFSAEAHIAGDTVELTSPEVPAPAKVHFAWHETARPALANRAGWPAWPFRSDAPTWRPSAP